MTPNKSQENVFQDDIRDLLEALDLGTHARPKSPHEVLQDEVLPKVDQMHERVEILYEAISKARIHANSRAKHILTDGLKEAGLYPPQTGG